MLFPIRDVSRCHEYHRLTVLRTKPSAAMLVNARGVKIAMLMLAKSMPAAERELKMCSDPTPNNANMSQWIVPRCWRILNPERVDSSHAQEAKRRYLARRVTAASDTTAPLSPKSQTARLKRQAHLPIPSIQAGCPVRPTSPSPSSKSHWKDEPDA